MILVKKIDWSCRYEHMKTFWIKKIKPLFLEKIILAIVMLGTCQLIKKISEIETFLNSVVKNLKVYIVKDNLFLGKTNNFIEMNIVWFDFTEIEKHCYIYH